MGFFGAIDRDALDRAFAAPEPETLPFGEGFDAVRESTFLIDRTDSLAYQAQDAASRSLARLRDLGVDVPEFPSWTWSNRQTKAALAVLDQKAADVAALRSPESGPSDPFLKTGAEIQKEAEERVAQARARASRAGFGAQLAGGMAGQITDPLNVALLPLGVASAERLLAKVAIEAAVGAASQTAVEAASLEAKDFAGVTPTTGEVVSNVALTGAFGAGLAGLFHGAGVVARRAGLLSEYRRKVASGEVTPTRELDAAADSLQDAIDTIPPRATPEAEAAHLDAVAAATDALRAEHPIEQAAALRRLEDKARWAEQREAELTARVAESEAAAVAQGVGRATNFGFNVARGGIAEAFGVDVRATRVDGGVRLDIPKSVAGEGPSSLTLLDADGIPAARAALDDFMAAHGKERVPLSKREQATAELELLRAEREAQARKAEGARVEASRRVGDSIGQPGGKPFKTRKEADQYARRTGVGDFEVVPMGRGFVVRPEIPQAIPGWLPMEEGLRARRAADIDAEIEAEAANPLPPVTDEPVALDAQPTDYATPETLAAFEQHIADTPDAPGAYIAEDGNLKAGTARGLVASLAEEERELRDILNCVLTPGGAD